MTGQVFVKTVGTQLHAVNVWSQPGSGIPACPFCTIPVGASVEIIQSMWYVTPGSQGCYHYLVRTNAGLGGWVEGAWLTPDLKLPSSESCFKQFPTSIPIHSILARPAYLTTQGSQKDAVDFWSGPTLNEGDGHILFSKPHGEQVDPIKYQPYTGPSGQTCRVYYVHTQDGLEGWVAEGWLAQNPDLSPMQVGCRE